MDIYEKIEFYNKLKKEIEEELQAGFDEIEIVKEYTDEMYCENGRYYYDTSRCEETTPTVLCIKKQAPN